MSEPLARVRASIPGRLPMLTLFAGASSSIALPWIPSALTERVRGAIAQDVATRAGLTLLPEARRILSAPAFEGGGLRPLARAFRFSATRALLRWVPLASFLPATFAAFSAFALGHLFERYLSFGRSHDATRIDAEEALRIRSLIDTAILKTVTMKRDAGGKGPGAGEELRDAMTQLVDSVLLGAATLPAWLLERLDAAFDEAMRA